MVSTQASKIIRLIGVAACEGAPDSRCMKGPAALYTLAQQRGWFEPNLPYQWGGMLSLDESSLLNLYNRLSQQVAQSILAGEFVTVLGGDHSCAIGTWSGVASALAKEGDLGLIWVDAHMDAHTPETSPSGALHGMPVSCLLGYGLQGFNHLAGLGPALKPENLCLVGVRSFESGERDFLSAMGVKVFSIGDVRRLGLTQVMQQAYEQVSQNTAGIGITIDMDAIDPAYAPGVGSPVVGGLLAQELLAVLAPFASDERLRALEIVEFNPVMDIDQRTATLALDLVESLTRPSKALVRP